MTISEITSPDLRSETVVSADDLTVRLVGSAESDAMKPLDTYLKSVHAAAAPSKLPVTVDLRALEFMNSSSFKAFVTWIRSLQDLPQEAQYRVKLISDSKKHWQERSLAALACFAVDLIQIETV
jgi:hypothetical protein